MLPEIVQIILDGSSPCMFRRPPVYVAARAVQRGDSGNSGRYRVPLTGWWLLVASLSALPGCDLYFAMIVSTNDISNVPRSGHQKPRLRRLVQVRSCSHGAFVGKQFMFILPITGSSAITADTCSLPYPRRRLPAQPAAIWCLYCSTGQKTSASRQPNMFARCALSFFLFHPKHTTTSCKVRSGGTDSNNNH